MEGIDRFIKAQENSYNHALEEIKNGRKKSHWIWYIFPQLKGLGSSEISKYYSIRSRNEAEEYIKHPVLGSRLIEISNELLKLDTNNADDVMGWPDNMKLKSSMTLFALVSDNDISRRVLDKFFDGEMDEFTVQNLK